LTSDTQTAGDILAAGGTGKIDVGSDLVIWTKHFTKFITYTQTSLTATDDTTTTKKKHSGSASIPVNTEDGKEQENTENPPQPDKPEITDINGHWAAENITKLISLGAIKGYPDGTFKPDNAITRAEFATILVKAFKLEKHTGKIFDDTVGHWANEHIATAQYYGIVRGYSDNRFGPDDVITREQMTVMIISAAKLTDQSEDKSFADSSDISGWAKAAVGLAAKKGIISGYKDNSFRPQGKAFR
jgi:hypothetical protein